MTKPRARAPQGVKTCSSFDPRGAEQREAPHTARRVPPTPSSDLDARPGSNEVRPVVPGNPEPTLDVPADVRPQADARPTHQAERRGRVAVAELEVEVEA